MRALYFSQTDLSKYLAHPQLTFPTMDQNGFQRHFHVSQVTTLICFTQEALLSGHNDFSFMLTEQQRLIIADMINNEILRYENGIKEDGPQITTANKGLAKNETIIDGPDDKGAPSEAVSISNKN